MSNKTMPKKPTSKPKAKKRRRMSKREFDRAIDQLGNGGLAALTRGRFF